MKKNTIFPEHPLLSEYLFLEPQVYRGWSVFGQSVWDEYCQRKGKALDPSLRSLSPDSLILYKRIVCIYISWQKKFNISNSKVQERAKSMNIFVKKGNIKLPKAR